ncbi:hypothetical protein [Flavobacterium sp. N502540]|uniref:hypothetical protein n=1 Tax=Flavobacterium sp. N502540 TaxID=2986838 RepID=UPI00222512BA|nr:hypothetical protein [Flavobacterium sp. N502540]
MKTIKVKVRISDGLAPLPIRVEIKNIDTRKEIEYESPTSFNQDFNIESGRYTLKLFGMNAINGKTEIELVGSFTRGPFHNAKRVTTKPFITELFYFEI